MKLRISEIREARHMTQEQLGEIVDLTAATISRIESGYQTKTLNRLKRIADALGVDMMELFDLESRDPKRIKLLRLLDQLQPEDYDTAARVLAGLSRDPS